MDTSIHNKVRQDFDDEVRRALSAILGAAISYPQWIQASLPVSKGGFGLRSAKVHRLGAYLASLFTAQPIVQHMRHADRAKETVLEELPIFNPKQLVEGV